MKILVAAVILVAACSTKQKAEITEKTMADRDRRLELMEAQLRVMDDHPEYVDELFQATLRHGRTLDRFLSDTARAVAHPKLAKVVAGHLVEEPDGLRAIMVATLDAARPRAGARSAIVNAMMDRRDVAAQYLVAEPDKMTEIFKAIVSAIGDAPDTKEKLKQIAKQLL